ncbi:hypothetical protein BG842_02620 [Haladaptatus sp. W1]|uniref:hypothetical protein n=1 Tax=Haladaptatus sp. W1 TaxID=1897478 RepID=UPI0008497B76|nr:hypothetical protein [Haladaptatus sp. W1]ODR80872.1 hypothetical protein BG842_02620 [Haladaptatus sp. W1]
MSLLFQAVEIIVAAFHTLASVPLVQPLSTFLAERMFAVFFTNSLVPTFLGYSAPEFNALLGDIVASYLAIVGVLIGASKIIPGAGR